MKKQGGNPNIGNTSIELGQNNRDAVYLAIRNLITIYQPEKKGVRLKEIWNELDRRTELENKITEKKIKQMTERGKKKWTTGDLERNEQVLKRLRKNTITTRTIQNCIAKDPRIKKAGWLFYINHEAIYEKRYLRPTEFGRRLYRRYLDETVGAITTLQEQESPETALKKLVTKLGVFLIFSFIEAARPFKDMSMSIGEREDLVYYWVQNCIPLFEIFSNFRSKFDQRAKVGADRTKAFSEMDESAIEHVLAMLNKLHPSLTKALYRISNEEVDTVLGVKSYYVRAKEFYPSWPTET